MKKSLLLVTFLFLCTCVFSQGFELSALLDSYKGNIGETIKAPLHLKNTSDKTITLIVRKVSEQIGSTQKAYFCLNDDCIDRRGEDYFIKIEPGEGQSLEIMLEAGLVSGISSIRYLVFNKSTPNQITEFDLNFVVDEKSEKPKLYNSRNIWVNDVYPNPVNDQAFVDYRIFNEKAKAVVRIHNILGNIVGEYDLPPDENLLRIKTDELSAGIYFYTLYIDNTGVMTRKIIVKK